MVPVAGLSEWRQHGSRARSVTAIHRSSKGERITADSAGYNQIRDRPRGIRRVGIERACCRNVAVELA